MEDLKYKAESLRLSNCRWPGAASKEETMKDMIDWLVERERNYRMKIIVKSKLM